MIPGFEEFTMDVTESDIEAINLVVQGLSVRVGVHKAITNAEMREKLYLNKGINIPDAKMRKYIQYIRGYRLVSMLCASSKGYWVAATKEEWIKYREGFRSRVRSMSFTLACMELDTIEGNVLK